MKDLRVGGHVSDPAWLQGEKGANALSAYLSWYNKAKAKDPTWNPDWVAKELAVDEFMIEAFHRITVGRDNAPAGSMNYFQQDDLIVHQSADRWLLIWKTYGIQKKFGLNLREWFDLPYAEAEHLHRRARAEDKAKAEAMEKARAEEEAARRNGRPQAPPTIPSNISVEDIAAAFGGGDQ